MCSGEARRISANKLGASACLAVLASAPFEFGNCISCLHATCSWKEDLFCKAFDVCGLSAYHFKLSSTVMLVCKHAFWYTSSGFMHKTIWYGQSAMSEFDS